MRRTSPPLRRPNLALITVFAFACSSSEKPAATPEPCAASGITSKFRFPGGSAEGHVDPYGAKAAGQARAGRIRDASMIHQAADVKAKARVGDFVLANDRVSAIIASARVTDGYVPFGGEIVSLDPIGEDGLPKKVGHYEESLIAFSRQTLAAEAVSVLSDGADGKEAVVRASGVLKTVAVLEVLGGLLRTEFGFPIAIDYVLAPGSEKIRLRLSMANTTNEEASIGSREIHGFLHNSRAKLFTQNAGYDTSSGQVPFLVYDGGAYGFAWRLVDRALQSGIDVSGFQYFNGNGLTFDACSQKTMEYVDIIPGGPEVDGVLAAVRRVNADTSHHAVSGRVVESTGEPTADGWVLALARNGTVVSRTKSDADGRFVIHVPNEDTTRIAVHKRGHWSPDPVVAPATEGEVTITMRARSTLRVHVKEQGTGRPLPSRVQVIPSAPMAPLPPAWGIGEEAEGRLHQAFPENGEATLPLPPGEHRVIVTRGYEYELYDQTITIEAGQTKDIDVSLLHSVDTSNVMCADFHVHSLYSPDSSDAVETKVRCAVADGLDIPVSSEHEYVFDFAPVVASLGLSDFAFGMSSEELSTWTIGHFGVVPKMRDESVANGGALAWYGKRGPEIFRMVNELPEKPVLIVNHPHAQGFQGYFTATAFKTDRAAGEGEDWSDAYGALEVFNETDFESNRTASVASWFAVLNTGKNAWAVGNGDSHHVRTDPVGYPRNCLRFGHDDPRKLSPDVVRDTLRSGANVVGGGLYMTVTSPDGKGPGETSTAGAYKVVVRAPSWIEAKTLEAIVDGETIRTIDLVKTGAGPANEYEATVDVAATSTRPRHWVVFHAKGPDGKTLAPLHPTKKPFAMSNPIFF